MTSSAIVAATAARPAVTNVLFTNIMSPVKHDAATTAAMRIAPSATGRWEVAGRLTGHELRFVVNVVPNPLSPATISTTSAFAATTGARDKGGATG